MDLKQKDLFGKEVINGAEFSMCRTYRYALWRIWDESLPLVMFIGLNPSTANASKNDRTIESVIRISKANGYGGFYMMNCWPFIATKPKDLERNPVSNVYNNHVLKVIAGKCQDIVFAWGKFSIVKDTGREDELKAMFPKAKVIGYNDDGSPKHPLFQKGTSLLIDIQ